VSGSGICWAICKSAPHPRQPRQHPTTRFFTGWMPFLPRNQQRQSTEGILGVKKLPCVSPVSAFAQLHAHHALILDLRSVLSTGDGRRSTVDNNRRVVANYRLFYVIAEFETKFQWKVLDTRIPYEPFLHRRACDRRTDRQGHSKCRAVA